MKAVLRCDYVVMTKDDWTKFDTQLRANLLADKLDVEVSQNPMRTHYDHLTGCVVKEAELAVPHKKKTDLQR